MRVKGDHFGEFSDDLAPATIAEFPPGTWEQDILISDTVRELLRLPSAEVTDDGEVYHDRPTAEFTLGQHQEFPAELREFMETNLIPYFIIPTDGSHGPRLMTFTGLYTGVRTILWVLEHEFLEPETDQNV